MWQWGSGLGPGVPKEPDPHAARVPPVGEPHPGRSEGLPIVLKLVACPLWSPGSGPTMN